MARQAGAPFFLRYGFFLGLFGAVVLALLFLEWGGEGWSHARGVPNQSRRPPDLSLPRLAVDEHLERGRLYGGGRLVFA